MLSDVELIRAVVAGEAAAADEWVRRHRRLVIGLARRRYGFDAEQAEEVLQATVAALWADDRRALRAWRGEGRFSTYLTVVVCRICRRRLGDHRRRRDVERSPGELFEEPADTSPSPDEAATRRQRRQAISEAVACLRPRDRLIIALRFVDGREPRDMAPLLGLSAGAVRKAIHDAVGRLRRRLARDDLGRVVAFGRRER